MTLPLGKRLVRLAAGTAVALLSALVLMVAPARAGCVHPAGAGHRDVGAAHFDRLAQAGALAEAEPVEQPAPPSGCPACSRDESTPQAPAPGIAPVESRDGLATAPAAVDAPDSALFPAAEGIARPRNRARPVFHPPPLSH